MAAIPRVLVAIAYRPALFFSDSWSYTLLAFSSSHLAPDRPSGYPALLWLLALPGRNLAVVTTMQHAAGLLTGVVAYTLLRRLAIPTWAASAATGVIVLEAYAIVLEQTVLAEAFFTLALMLAALLAVGKSGSRLSLATGGLLLAAAATMRTVAIFAVPIWLAYVVWRHRRPALVGVAAMSIALPLVGYAAIYNAKQGSFGLTSADGWFLYGRVAQIADCSTFEPPRGTARLCEPRSELGRHAPVYYIWSGASPANRRFGTIGSAGSNEPLKEFATAVIRARPVAYARMVVLDFGRYFVPGVASPGRSDAAVTLPARPRTGPPWMYEELRRTYFPSYVPAVHRPSAIARLYAAVVRPARPLLALLVLVTLGAMGLGLVGRSRHALPRLPEAMVLTGMGLAMLAGSALTSSFVLRYLIPTVPLIVCGGVVAAADLAGLRRKHTARASLRPTHTVEARVTPEVRG